MHTARPSLDDPPADASRHSAAVVQYIVDRIRAAGGWLSFADYMQHALYAPGLGYYSAGSHKLGAGGDFVTAPELTPLFGEAIACQAAQVIAGTAPDILEIGPGSGALAVSLLEALDRANALPARYLILEVSADLRARAAARLARCAPRIAQRVAWLDRLPESFAGFVLANEVLDAMPVHVVELREQVMIEVGVGLDHEDRLCWGERPARGAVLDAATAIASAHALPSPYRIEIGLLARGFVHSIGRMLQRGVALFIDYGFPAHELYHPQRAMGTVRCHYRHRVHDDPLYLPGLCDLTAHVDFSAIDVAARASGLALGGFTTQASLLINCGITELLSRTPPDQPARYLPIANAVQRLMSPAEMGELFKAIAVTREFDQPLIGFAAGDRRAALSVAR